MQENFDLSLFCDTVVRICQRELINQKHVDVPVNTGSALVCQQKQDA